MAQAYELVELWHQDNPDAAGISDRWAAVLLLNEQSCGSLNQVCSIIVMLIQGYTKGLHKRVQQQLTCRHECAASRVSLLLAGFRTSLASTSKIPVIILTCLLGPGPSPAPAPGEPALGPPVDPGGLPSFFLPSAEPGRLASEL